MSDVTLGLDLGPNSIGWALVSQSKKEIIATGVRVFPEGVDAFDTAKEKSRNEQRRTARGMRRQHQRRSKRKQLLRSALVSSGLLPTDKEQMAEVMALDPYEIRAKAASEKLTEFELGRAFYHLNQRRGFLSNRKKDRTDSEVKGMLAEISELADEMGDKTLGEHLYEKVAKPGEIPLGDEHRARGQHTRRQMLINEFKQIWETQKAFHGELLTDELRYGEVGEDAVPKVPIECPQDKTWLEHFGLFGLMFFQRKMYWPTSVIGECELEKKKKRCPRADRLAQKFRLLQEVNNLRYTSPETNDEHTLNDEQRTLLIDKLSKQKEMTFAKIKEALGFLESVKFNLEMGKRPKLLGMATDAVLHKALDKTWYGRPDEVKTRVVEWMTEPNVDDQEFVRRVRELNEFTEEEIDCLLEIELPAGYIHLSREALKKLLPHMEKGLQYMANDESDSAVHAAGYLRRDQLQMRIFDKLPLPERTRDCPIGDLPNPVVRRAMVELRKLVNAIIREYGKPDHIHLEMAREVKQGREQRKKTSAEMRDQERRRSKAADQLVELGQKVNRENILRLLLWEDQEQTCLYTGRAISMAQLFGGEIDIDHILPYSRSLDNSQANKVICFRKGNSDKGNRTPYEWLAETAPKRYDDICQLAGRLMRDGKFAYSKYQRFIQKQLDVDEFIARQLVDTSYIARLAGEYLRCLFEHKHQVLGLKGRHTAEIRHIWGLGTILEEFNDSPAWQEAGNLRPGEKNRADHRHHAIDAIVLAFTNRSTLQALSKGRSGDRSNRTMDRPAEPWDSFRDDVREAIEGINVSHRVRRKVGGALHEETHYGPTETPGEWVVRKPLVDLSPNEVEMIRDETVRNLVTQRLSENGIEVGRKSKKDNNLWKSVLSDFRLPSGVPVKKVRVLKKDNTVRGLAHKEEGHLHIRPGDVHHVCLFQVSEKGKRKYLGVFVTRLEAAQRLASHDEIVQRQHPTIEEAEFLFSLSTGDHVLIRVDGSEKLMVVSTVVSTQQRVHLVSACDARRSSSKKDIGCTLKSLLEKYQARKVTVDLLGNIRWAND